MPGSRGVSKVEIAWFSRLFWVVGLRKRAKVELRLKREGKVLDDIAITCIHPGVNRFHDGEADAPIGIRVQAV